jgi:hypothetical protein
MPVVRRGATTATETMQLAQCFEITAGDCLIQQAGELLDKYSIYAMIKVLFALTRSHRGFSAVATTHIEVLAHKPEGNLESANDMYRLPARFAGSHQPPHCGQQGGLHGQTSASARRCGVGEQELQDPEHRPGRRRAPRWFGRRHWLHPDLRADQHRDLTGRTCRRR